MTQMLRRIVAALGTTSAATQPLRFSRGIGPRVAPRHRRW